MSDTALATSKARLSLIDKLNVASIKKGGRCLSTNILDGRVYATLECAYGHTWTTTATNITKSNSPTWCYECSISYPERLCRAIFERMYCVPFPRVRPEFLSTGIGRLELDGFNDSLSVAFEYHGQQHYDMHPTWWGGREKFISQQKRDGLKSIICRKNGVSLVVVPYFTDPYNLQLCIAEIEYALTESGNVAPPWVRPGYIPELLHPIDGVYGFETASNMRAYAEAKGGILLSNFAYGTGEKLKWRCSKGHEWIAAWSRLMGRGDWCRRCRNDGLREGIEKAREYASERGGFCHSQEYTRNDVPLEWECFRGHKWKNPWRDQKRRNGWCQKCYQEDSRIGDAGLNQARQIAEAKGGKCLSDVCVTAKSPMLWECRMGHTWKAPLHRIKSQGGWCPQCSRC